MVERAPQRLKRLHEMMHAIVFESLCSRHEQVSKQFHILHVYIYIYIGMSMLKHIYIYEYNHILCII